jgi:hypothetical protein
VLGLQVCAIMSDSFAFMMSQNPKQEALSLVLSALVKTDIDY